MTLRTVEATIDENGQLLLKDDVDLKGKHVLITILPANDYESISAGKYAALMSQEVLSRDWDSSEEDEAWGHLQDLDSSKE